MPLTNSKFKTLYEVLEVSETDSQLIINQSYRRLIQSYNPLTNPQGAARFHEIKCANKILSNIKNRAAYNEWLQNNRGKLFSAFYDYLGNSGYFSKLINASEYFAECSQNNFMVDQEIRAFLAERENQKKNWLDRHADFLKKLTDWYAGEDLYKHIVASYTPRQLYQLFFDQNNSPLHVLGRKFDGVKFTALMSPFSASMRWQILQQYNKGDLLNHFLLFENTDYQQVLINELLNPSKWINELSQLKITIEQKHPNLDFAKPIDHLIRLIENEPFSKKQNFEILKKCHQQPLLQTLKKTNILLQALISQDVGQITKAIQDYERFLGENNDYPYNWKAAIAAKLMQLASAVCIGLIIGSLTGFLLTSFVPPIAIALAITVTVALFASSNPLATDLAKDFRFFKAPLACVHEDILEKADEINPQKNV